MGNRPLYKYMTPTPSTFQTLVRENLPLPSVIITPYLLVLLFNVNYDSNHNSTPKLKPKHVYAKSKVIVEVYSELAQMLVKAEASLKDI